jgi:hypothetical protein
MVRTIFEYVEAFYFEHTNNVECYLCLVSYFVDVETKGHTLEELDDIFNARNPGKASLAKKRVIVAAGNV